MNVLAPGLSWVDLEFLGRPRAIAAALVAGPDGVAIVDPGPTTCIGTLELGLERQGCRLSDVRWLLLTHIHLDHAGAAGSLVAAWPAIRVLVHERGAPHLADPSKLVASAARLYGDQMHRLWGAVVPVPAGNIDVLRGGETVAAGGRTFEVAYTPGHASHHVSYFDPSSRVAFVGDTAGISVDGGWVLPPTPPPDVDIELWKESARRIEAWSPDTLFLTHFGPSMHARTHLGALVDHLDLVAAIARDVLGEPGTDEERAGRYAERLRHELRRHMGEAQVASYTIAVPFEQAFAGLARYWRKRTGGAAG